MLELQLTLNCPQLEVLAKSIEALAQVRTRTHVKHIAEAPKAEAPAPAPKAEAPAPKAEAPAPKAEAPAPKAEAPAPAPVVPVATEPSYRLEDIALATVALRDAGKLDQIKALLEQYSINMLTDLKPEQFGAFAASLREIGGRI